MIIRFGGYALLLILVSGGFQTLLALPLFLTRYQGDQLRNEAINGCGVCHVDPAGGGDRNDFGNAFSEAEYTITPMLRASFPDLFVVPVNELGDGSRFYFADPQGRTVVVERDGQKHLLDLDAVLSGRRPDEEGGDYERIRTGARTLAEDWFTRLNALDDWEVYGHPDNTIVVDQFMELYGANAYHQVGPGENQLGPVVYHGTAAIRRWAEEFSETYDELNYRIEYKTRQENTLEPVYVIEFPWGALGAAVEFHAVYRNRQDRRRFVAPGSVFFIFDRSGRIDSLRVYILTDERVQVGG